MAQNDPRWINTQFPGRCKGCNRRIERWSRTYYFPLTKALYCILCGTDEHADFSAAAFDEAVYAGGWA